MQRRHFLQALSAAGVAATGMLSPNGRSAWAAGPISSAQATTQKKLIVIFLRGAVDGLSVVAPYA